MAEAVPSMWQKFACTETSSPSSSAQLLSPPASPPASATASSSRRLAGTRVFHTIVTMESKHVQNRMTLTWSDSTMDVVVFGLGRMAGPPPLARIWGRVRVVVVSIVSWSSQYRPCFLPYPAHMTTSPSRSWELGS